ncbi:hypothetical protein ACIOGZ_29840 [Kitasatospora sp. NPDC088160]
MPVPFPSARLAGVGGQAAGEHPGDRVEGVPQLEVLGRVGR